ncbi:hypothetical protein MBANPS3_012661, partial [Mucor bainieri]
MPPKQDPLNNDSPLSSREGTPQITTGSPPQDRQPEGPSHQDAEATRENLESLKISNRRPSHEERSSITPEPPIPGTPDEDIVMDEAPAVNKESTVSDKKRDPVLVLKKVIARRDTYFNLYTDMVSTEASDDKAVKHLQEIRAKIEGLNKDISVLKNSVRLSDDKVTAAVESSIATTANGGIRLSKQDLPKFQLKSSSTKYFPKDEAYESVNHFLRSFEKVISSSGENIELIWKRYVPLTLPYELDNWLNNDVLTCRTW